MKFIGRKMELEKLNAEYERDGGFVVIYGRRPADEEVDRLVKERVLEKENSLLLPCNRRIGISKHETFSGRCCSYDEKQPFTESCIYRLA